MTIHHSFAVMAYKDSPFLAECLDSIQSQTVESKVYIATSTMSAYLEGIAKKYNVEIFAAEPGRGIAYDWNFSLRKADTKYVTLAHQDDIYMPDYTSSCLRAAEEFDDTLICFTGYSEIAGDKERSKTILLGVKKWMLRCFTPFRKDIRHKFWRKKLLSLGCPIAAPSVMYNLDLLSGFLFSSEFSINMDWDAWTRMTQMNGRFVYVDKVLLKHRIHPDSATTSGLQNNFRQEEDLRMFNLFWPRFFAKLLARLYSKSYRSNNDVLP